jgi:hypothetical protein
MGVVCQVHARMKARNVSLFGSAASAVARLAAAWRMRKRQGEFTMPQAATSRVDPHTFVKGVHGVRYQVKDVARSVAF